MKGLLGHNPIINPGRSVSHLLEGRVFAYIIWNSPIQRFIYSPHVFIDLTIYLYHYEFMNIYFYFRLLSNATLFICCSKVFAFSYWELFWLSLLSL